jgi:hypothetical protein
MKGKVTFSFFLSEQGMVEACKRGLREIEP